MLAQLLIGSLAFRATVGSRPALSLANARVTPVVACTDGWVTSSTGLRFLDEKTGQGDGAKKGDIITFDYSSRVVDGDELDSTEGKKPIQFELGKLDVIPGWGEGLEGMKEGGSRKIQIPPSLWNGAQGTAKGVPKDASLEFDFQMVQVYTPTIVERYGKQNLVLAALIALIGVYEAYVVLTGSAS